MNIFSNFTPNNLVTFADRDPSINDFVKNKIKMEKSILLEDIYQK